MKYLKFNKFSTKDQLIKMSLMNVNKYGWTENSIKIASNELGFSNQLSSMLLNGPFDLIKYMIDNWNKKLLNEINSIKDDKLLSIDDKYKKIIKIRLSYQIPNLNTWPQAINISLRPENISITVGHLLDTVNIITSIEDNPTKSKKYIILKIIAISEFHLITDRSYNYNDTWKLLDQIYSINMGIYNGIEKFSMINSAFLKLSKYSLTSLLPYDFSKVDELIRLKENI